MVARAEVVVMIAFFVVVAIIVGYLFGFAMGWWSRGIIGGRNAQGKW